MRLIAAVLAAVLLASCASGPEGVDDPYETANRETFAMNQRMDGMVLRPLAESYVEAVPESVRGPIHNLLVTANLPVVFANDLLQLRLLRAGETLARFAVNATIGIAGLRDTAGDLGLPDHNTDFGLTLARWGMGDGPYLMLPVIGPSNPRDALGFVGDIALDPGFVIQYKQYVWWITLRKAATIVDARANMLDTLDDIERNSMDYYSALRSVYRQHRASQTETDETP